MLGAICNLIFGSKKPKAMTIYERSAQDRCDDIVRSLELNPYEWTTNHSWSAIHYENKWDLYASNDIWIEVTLNDADVFTKKQQRKIYLAVKDMQSYQALYGKFNPAKEED